MASVVRRNQLAETIGPIDTLPNTGWLDAEAPMDATHNTVYVETSIPSLYYTLRTDPESVARMHWTRQWWQEYADKSSLVTSAAIIEELQQGTGGKNEERISLLDQATVLPISDEVIEIAQVYIDKLVMPRDPRGDALHLAFAS